MLTSEIGEVSFNKPEPINNLITWVYENGSFVPIGKLTENESFSIVSDYLGTPVQAYDQSGNLIWERELDIYGRVRKLKGDKHFCNFLYQGQYYDKETELAYNRFRYYDPNSGLYISQDPIGLAGGLSFYAYVHDANGWVDVFGLHGNELTNITDSILYDIKINGMQFKYGIADATRTIKKDILVVQPNGNIAVIPKGTAVRLHQQLRKAYSNFDDVQVSSTLFKQKTTAFMKDKENRLISKFVQSNGKVPSGNKAHALKGLGSLADDFNGIHDLRKDLKMKNNKAKHH